MAKPKYQAVPAQQQMSELAALNRIKQFNNFQQNIRNQRAANAAAREASAEERSGGPTDGGSGWDTALHVGGRALDVLSSLGYGVENQLSEALKHLEAAGQSVAKGEKVDPGKVLGDTVNELVNPVERAGNFFKGVGDAWTGNTKDLVHGHELIERTTDAIGNASAPQTGYKDVKDNVDPVAKGVGGFALDVVADPLTAAPAGPALRGVEGAFKASTAAARAAQGGDVAKTLAFFNPVTAAKGAGQGVKQWGQEARDVIKGLGAKPEVAAADALNTGKRVAANLAGASGRKAPTVPASASAASKAADDIVNPGAAPTVASEAAQAAPGPVLRETAEGTLEVAPETAARNAPTPAPVSAPVPKTEPEVQAEAVVEAASDAASDVAEKSIRQTMAEQLAPDIARASAAGSNTTDILANLRALTYQTNQFTQRAQVAARKLTPAPTKGKAEKEAWLAAATEAVGEDGARVLSKIKDPVEFAARARQIANTRLTNTLEGRTPDDIFRKLKSNRNEFDAAKVAAIARDLGLKDIPEVEANWKTFSDFLRRVDAKVAYDELKRAELSNRDLLKGTSLPGASVAEARAKALDPEAEKVDYGLQADEVLIDPVMAQHVDDAIVNVFPADFEAKYKHVVNNPKTGESFHGTAPEFGDDFKGVNRFTWNQNTQYTLWKNLFEDFKKAGSGADVTPAARAGIQYQMFKDALTYADLRLKSLGIVPVNGAFKAERDLFKTKGDYAFFSFGDLINALPEDTAKALFFSGKDLNVPPTLMVDLAREALRIAETESSTIDLASHLLHKAQQSLTRLWGGEKMSSIQKRLTANKDLLKGMVGAIADPEFVQKLAAANIRNLSFGVAVNGRRAAHATAPILNTLRNFALDPNVSTGQEVDAILEARDALRAAVKGADAEGTPAEGLAETMLEKGMAQTTTTAKMAVARAAQAQDRAVVDSSGQPVSKTVKAERKAKADQTAVEHNLPGKERGPKQLPKTEGAKKAEQNTRNAAATARTAEHAAAQAPAKQMVNGVANGQNAVIDDPVWDIDAAQAAFTMDLPAWLRTTFKGMEKFDGWFGKNNVKAAAISAEMNAQTMMHSYSRALKEARGTHAPEALQGAVSVFTKMDGNAGLDVALEGVDPATAAAARQLWPTFSVIFDHSEHGLLQRIGLDGSYLNDYLRREGVDDQFLMNGSQTWENGTSWKHWNWGKTDPLKLLDDYHHAIIRAQVVPDVAASFAAQFGNKSTVHGAPLTAEQAKAAGWVKANTEQGRFGSLFQFLDKDQYYPREMLTELANMDKYFAASRSLDEQGMFDKFFRYVDPITNSLKASVTLWRPGHHVTNVLGESLMNTLAGVVNPIDYVAAYKMLGGAGRADRKSASALENYLKLAAPEGLQLKQAVGIPVKIRGGNVDEISPSQAYDLLNNSGAIIHHNQAEDIINEGQQVIGRSADSSAGVKTPQKTAVLNALQKINKTAAPGWLGTFSANRDNVFRLAHAAKILRTREFDNVQQAMSAITKEINSFHPNMLTLGAAEQKYVRRFIYFYTWQRQAITRVFMSMIDTPGRITIAPKALYNAGIAGGVEGQSFGEPVPDEGDIPDYLRGNIGQFMFYDALHSGDAAGMQDYLWGSSINAPQLDILQSVFGSVAVDPAASPVDQFWGVSNELVDKNIWQNLPPIFKIPAELGTRAKFGTGTPIEEGTETQYLLDQTGLRAPLLFTGVTDTGEEDPDIDQQKRETALWNFLTGTKKTVYNGPEQYDIWYRQQLEKARKLAEADSPE